MLGNLRAAVGGTEHRELQGRSNTRKACEPQRLVTPCRGDRSSEDSDELRKLLEQLSI